MKKYVAPVFMFAFFSLAGFMQMRAAPAFGQVRAYYFCANGNDNNDGSLQHPWQTLRKLNNLSLQPGDAVKLKGGDVFEGTVRLVNITGTQALPIRIQSYGKGKAMIQAKDSAAFVATGCAYVFISHFTFIGSGRKEGNTKDGFTIDSSHYIQVDNIDISGFQKAGLLIFDSRNIEAGDVFAHDNGFAGIFVSGEYGDKLHCKNIKLINCHAENNPGDPTNFGNHSGNGILAGFCTQVLIDSCTADNNGWDMPRIGNGPVGIWCFEADSIIIQHCISCQNKTSKGGEDGGGYDLDGGTTNSVIQYCLSYQNQGSAFGIFQYDGATPWHDNVIRWCISEDDGNVSAAHANAYVWNSSHDSSQLKNLLFYNNTLVNRTGNAIAYSTESEHSNFCFYNNIFVANCSLLRGDYRKDVFLGNDWWSIKYGFEIDSIYDFKKWTNLCGKEQMGGKRYGLNTKPLFKNGDAMNNEKIVSPSFFVNHYQLSSPSALSLAGIDLQQWFHLNIGKVDVAGRHVKRNGIGACVKQE